MQQFLVNVTETAITHYHDMIACVTILFQEPNDLLYFEKRITRHLALPDERIEVDVCVFRFKPNHHICRLAGYIKFMLMDTEFHSIGTWFDYSN